MEDLEQLSVGRPYKNSSVRDQTRKIQLLSHNSVTAPTVSSKIQNSIQLIKRCSILCHQVYTHTPKKLQNLFTSFQLKLHQLTFPIQLAMTLRGVGSTILAVKIRANDDGSQPSPVTGTSWLSGGHTGHQPARGCCLIRALTPRLGEAHVSTRMGSESGGGSILSH